jgi:hypothetical protein
METFPIDPPIIVSESGDVETFESVAAAESYLEPIDVEKGRYIAYDSRGRLLQLIPTSPQVSIRAAEKDAGHHRELQDLLIEFFKRVGVSGDWLGQASLQDLVEKSSEYRVISTSPMDQIKTFLKRAFTPRGD